MGAGAKVAMTLPTLIRNMRRESPKMIKRPLPSLRRAFSIYDQINLFDNVSEDQLRFQGFSETGFLINGVNYEGSLLCVDKLVFSWSPKRFSDITTDSFTIFQLLKPTPDILILGCGKQIEIANPELRRFIRSLGMKLEVSDSRNAVSTFNILSEEGRAVAAAFLPCGAFS